MNEDWWLGALRHGGLADLVRSQDNVVSRQQWLTSGGCIGELRRHLRRRQWQTLLPGVYATEPGAVSKIGLSIAALLYVGRGAMWCHVTAAEQWGLVRPSHDSPIHVLVPGGRRVRTQSGLRLHYSTSAESRRAIGVQPPRVTPEHAVLDRVGDCTQFEAALAIVADSCQTGRVRLDDVLLRLASRRVRWGTELKAAAGSYLRGSDSLLEILYVRDVELAHRLPRSTRQRAAGHELADCSYDDFKVLVELDGRIHLEAIRRWRDMRRDNRSTLRGEATLRYGFIDVRQQPCEVAVQVLAVLRSRGFTGRVRACRPGCPVRGDRAPGPVHHALSRRRR